MRGGVRRGSIRARISVGVGTVAAIVLLPLAAILSMQLEDAADQTAAQLAADDLQPYTVDLRHQPGERPDPAGTGVLILIIDPQDRVRRDSMPDGLAAAARAVAVSRSLTTPAGRFEVETTSVTTRDGTWRLWAARDLTAGTALLNVVRLTALVGALLGVVVAGAGAWWIAGRALRPVEALRSTAEQLRTERGTALLPPLGDDELGRLSQTLNNLLGGLRASIAHERALTADVAHELRTPLAVLTGQLEAARRHPSPDLAPLTESVRHLTTLTDNLLALARADLPGTAPPHLNPVAELTVELMRSIDRARVIAGPAVLVDLAIDPDLPLQSLCRIDPVDFGRILDNLLGNAMKHARPVTSIIASMATAGDQLLLLVEDDGAGIPPALAPTAFERFTRGDDARGSGHSGAGLGMALVRQLARAAGGDAMIRPWRSAGTVIEVTVPLTTPGPEDGVGTAAATFEVSKPEEAGALPAGPRVDRSKESTP